MTVIEAIRQTQPLDGTPEEQETIQAEFPVIYEAIDGAVRRENDSAGDGTRRARTSNDWFFMNQLRFHRPEDRTLFYRGLEQRLRPYVIERIAGAAQRLTPERRNELQAVMNDNFQTDTPDISSGQTCSTFFIFQNCHYNRYDYRLEVPNDVSLFISEALEGRFPLLFAASCLVFTDPTAGDRPRIDTAGPESRSRSGLSYSLIRAILNNPQRRNYESR